MKTKALVYGTESGVVNMVIHVRPTMTWEVFATMIRGLKAFLNEWEYVECDFDIGQIGYDNFYGTGAIVGLNRELAVDSS